METVIIVIILAGLVAYFVIYLREHIRFKHYSKYLSMRSEILDLTAKSIRVGKRSIYIFNELAKTYKIPKELYDYTEIENLIDEIAKCQRSYDLGTQIIDKVYKR